MKVGTRIRLTSLPPGAHEFGVFYEVGDIGTVQTEPGVSGLMVVRFDRNTVVWMDPAYFEVVGKEADTSTPYGHGGDQE